ncbi:MAG: hypothetical protein AVDCRST_MAG66-4861 [uncultured Pseudonocardia sp.]|uniref:DUF1772 domain-containing protein n=1 Tax=uncultured Pseudonocardia sp. TaxID=211455 RepID=A0A6J4QL26_9PSEU|nr:MAG: hypothetical protein AVDCRST_MAG66-4861 [uncultured Pseudonocardia sp.]
MLTDLLTIIVLIGSGLTAGVLFAVALSVVPALLVMPADQYVSTHRLIGRNWDPTMPVIVLVSAAGDAALAVLVPGAGVWFASGAVLLLGVSVVSHFCNVPINRVVHEHAVQGVPADWHDPRPSWRRWHLVRTGLALLAFAGNALGALTAR